MYKWNLRNLIITFGPNEYDGNYGASGALLFEPNADDFTLTMSADGIGTRNATNDQSGIFTLKLAQSNPKNALLSAQRLIDISSPNGAGVATFALRDMQGTTLIVCESAWIKRPASGDWQREIQERGWQIETDRAIVFHGGN